MERSFIQIHPSDNIAVALRDISAGTAVSIGGRDYIAEEPIPFGHKMALCDIGENEDVIRYGCPIGHTTKAVHAGQWLHSHNVATNLSGLLDYEYAPVQPREKKSGLLPDSFMGYRRSSGRPGTRNDIWIIPTVSCVNTLCQAIAREAGSFPGVDAVLALPHNAGCSQLGDDHEMTQRILSSIVHHPNAGAVLLVSLGCENNDFEHFIPTLGDYDPERVRFMVSQDVEGDEKEEGLRIVRELAAVLSRDKRESFPVSELCIGFKCGGSDGFSGITANPLCGLIAERVTDLGGAAVLTEVPEMFGAEQFLMNRADSLETFGKVVRMINSFKQYYLDYGQPIYENPSPGNKRGGITTLEEKSLGCIQKGGHAVVTDTLEIGQMSEKPGLQLMTGPGNDSVSITNLLTSGAQLLLFTTGRGNPLGTAIPTVKIASNTALAERKANWIDFDAGEVLDKGMELPAEELWQYAVDVASGRKHTKNELNGFREIMIFKNGVLL